MNKNNLLTGHYKFAVLIPMVSEIKLFLLYFDSLDKFIKVKTRDILSSMPNFKVIFHDIMDEKVDERSWPIKV